MVKDYVDFTELARLHLIPAGDVAREYFGDILFGKYLYRVSGVYNEGEGVDGYLLLMHHFLVRAQIADLLVGERTGDYGTLHRAHGHDGVDGLVLGHVVGEDIFLGVDVFIYVYFLLHYVFKRLVAGNLGHCRLLGLFLASARCYGHGGHACGGDIEAVA